MGGRVEGQACAILLILTSRTLNFQCEFLTLAKFHLSVLTPELTDMSDRDKVLAILCPVKTTVEKLLGIMYFTRKNGSSSEMLLFYIKH